METEQVVQTPPAASSPAAQPQQTETTHEPESSAAAEAGHEFEAADFEGMTDAQRSEWLQTGKTPTKPAEAKPAADGEKTPPADGKPPEKKPESGPGKKLPGNKGEEVRVHTLLQERHRDRQRIQELEAQLAGGNKGAQPAASPTAPDGKPAAAVTELKPPVAPKLEDFGTWGEFMEAQNAYFEKLADFRADQKLADYKKSQEATVRDGKIAEQNKAVEKSWKTKVDTAISTHADFKDVAFSPALGAIIPQGSVIDAFVLKSPEGAEILYRLGSDLGEAERIAGLDPIDQAIELGQIQAEIRGSAAPAKPPAGQATVKHVSSASPPPRELGSPKANVADPVEAALEGKDFSTYQAEMNARDLKARTGK